MQISIFGTGYVGLVTGACLAEAGNTVTCVDVDEAKIEGLKNGVIPIYEPGLDKIVRENADADRLLFTTDAPEAIERAQIVFIAVGTPPDEDGSADLKYVLAVAATIGKHVTRRTIVVNKSTVPVGTAGIVSRTIAGQLQARGVDVEFDVVSNPEFLKEGAAVRDCMRPDRIVVGSDSEHAVEVMRRLYAPFNHNHDRIVVMDVRSAELTKYAANAMLATKISFMNEIANIAERVGADVEMVRHGIGSDPRIGYSFIYPGAGYGGSCFPKDVRALAQTAQQYGYTTQMLNAVEDVNNAQKHKLFELIERHFGGDLKGRTIALWGLAFKPNTDDMREAPSRTLLSRLWKAGAKVRAFDPEAMDETRRIYGERDDLVLCEDSASVLEDADALVLATEWKEFWSPDFAEIKRKLRKSVLFDGRNIYDPNEVREAGLTYYGIGRGESAAEGSAARS